MASKTLNELAHLVRGEIRGDGGVLIKGVRDIDHAGNGEITFLGNIKKLYLLDGAKAEAAVVPRDCPEINIPVIMVDDPGYAFAVIHSAFLERSFSPSGISQKSHVGNDCSIPAEVTIGPMSVLGDRVGLGQRVTIGAGVVIGDDVIIGDDSVLHSNVTIYRNCRIGSRVIIHSGSVIGADGFGYVTGPGGSHLKRPHEGTVQIDDDVELGANVCVDRATFGVTHIKSGSKIDNLVQIAHNVVVGENSLIVAQAGIAGSSSLGKNVVLGGQVGIAGHIHLGDRTMVGAQSGVHNNQDPDSLVSGTPAISHKKWLKASLTLEKIPELVKDVRKIKKDLGSLIENKED